jgi:hypothetical protein
MPPVAAGWAAQPSSEATSRTNNAFTMNRSCSRRGGAVIPSIVQTEKSVGRSGGCAGAALANAPSTARSFMDGNELGQVVEHGAGVADGVDVGGAAAPDGA